MSHPESCIRTVPYSAPLLLYHPQQPFETAVFAVQPLLKRMLYRNVHRRVCIRFVVGGNDLFAERHLKLHPTRNGQFYPCGISRHGIVPPNRSDDSSAHRPRRRSRASGAAGDIASDAPYRCGNGCRPARCRYSASYTPCRPRTSTDSGRRCSSPFRGIRPL